MHSRSLLSALALAYPASGQHFGEGGSWQGQRAGLAPAAVPPVVSPSTTTTTTSSSSSSSSSAILGGVTGLVAATPIVAAVASVSPDVVTSVPSQSSAVTGGSGGGAAAMTIELINSYGSGLSVSFGQNAGAPAPIGNPTPAPLGSSTSWTFPTQWAGRIYVGKTNAEANSKIEGSVTGPPDIDVSYVDGYSVPMTCSAGGVVQTGCNIELFDQNINCHASGSPANDGILCTNDAVNELTCVGVNCAPPFFKACAGAAYTYPKDDGANRGNVAASVSCCVGASCPAPDRQGAATAKKMMKRDDELDATVQLRQSRPRSPSHLARAHKREERRSKHGHESKHGLIHGAKVLW